MLIVRIPISITPARNISHLLVENRSIKGWISILNWSSFYLNTQLRVRWYLYEICQVMSTKCQCNYQSCLSSVYTSHAICQCVRFYFGTVHEMLVLIKLVIAYAQTLLTYTWVKVQNFQNPDLSKIQSLIKLAVCPQNIHNFKFKWSNVFRQTDNKSEKLF